MYTLFLIGNSEVEITGLKIAEPYACIYYLIMSGMTSM